MIIEVCGPHRQRTNTSVAGQFPTSQFLENLLCLLSVDSYDDAFCPPHPSARGPRLVPVRERQFSSPMRRSRRPFYSANAHKTEEALEAGIQFPCLDLSW